MIYDRCIWEKNGWATNCMLISLSYCNSMHRIYFVINKCTYSDAPTSVQPSEKKPVTMNGGVKPRPDGFHIVPLSQHPITYSPNTYTF